MYTRPEIEVMAINNPFIHVESADVKETFTYSDHPIAIVDVFEFGGMWNPVNRLIMFDAKTWGSLNEEEKRILLDHEIVERGLAMEDYAQYRSHSAAVGANHAKANAIVSKRYGADVMDDLIARGLLAK
ncbi:MAG: hypothetical protein HWN68_20865 [Desulfobacterales bacterium]|nr:hypothetical protein [Desulfobacterales bacterium]